VEGEIAPQGISELHLLLVNDARMREINFQFRKKDKPTDVLSFPQFTPQQMRGERAVGDEAGSYLGDLVISTETTIRQAKRFKVSLEAEVTRLLVHGVLHLCGYDHEKVPAREAQRMRRRERVIRAML
jgi:rRNA maturation RNase YbeY